MLNICLHLSGAEVKAAASSAADTAKDKAHEVKDTASKKADEIKT